MKIDAQEEKEKQATDKEAVALTQARGDGDGTRGSRCKVVGFGI